MRRDWRGRFDDVVKASRSLAHDVRDRSKTKVARIRAIAANAYPR